ncbi:MAG: hypothetical protein KAJ18_10305 [Candidatus Omnitrophica bacterium]|nr:hypothetical protein [Candidatus Omnitrophota bacterium]
MAEETAEQKLLKLIQEADSGEESVAEPAPEPLASVEAEAPAPEAQRLFEAVQGGPGAAPGAVSLSLPPFVLNFIAFFRGPIGVAEINKILFVFIVVVGTFFVMDFMRGMELSQGDVDIRVRTKIDIGTKGVIPQVKGASEYKNLVSKRNVFQPYERKVVDETELEDELMQENRLISEQVKNLKLVGISWLDTPETASAMIENTISGVTYFLRKGETLNNVVVEGIYSESIIVSFQGEELELEL